MNTNVYRLAKAGNSDDNLRAPVPTRRHSSEWYVIQVHTSATLITVYFSTKLRRILFILYFRRQWVAGIVFSIVIPSCTAKIGTIVTLMSK